MTKIDEPKVGEVWSYYSLGEWYATGVVLLVSKLPFNGFEDGVNCQMLILAHWEKSFPGPSNPTWSVDVSDTFRWKRVL